MKSKEIIRQLENDGWRIVRQKGSHIQLKKIGTPELITVPEHGNKDLSPGVYNKIRKIAEWK